MGMGMGMALAVGALMVQSPSRAEVPVTAASGEAAGPEPGAAAASEAEQAAERLELRREALTHLGGAPRAKLEHMSDEEIGALLDAAAPDQLGKEQQEIRTALGKVFFERQLQYQTGDIKIGDGLATLHLGKEFRYLNPADSEKLLVEGWGNPPGSKTLGMIVPANVSPLHEDNSWAVVVTYSEDGHVEDDDADDIDYDDLLKEMQQDTLAANDERKSQGYAAIELVGWAAPPRYDGATHRLYWAQELKFNDAPDHTLNYAIRVLGRKGVLELNAVAAMSQLPLVRGEMEKVLPRAEFETGSRYADFNPELDEVAAYGIGGLIAGKMLAKAGLFAVLLKFLIAAKKLLIVGLAAAGALVARLLKGRSRPPDGADGEQA
jgi:uncharacterized membrane-anchored protein